MSIQDLVALALTSAIGTMYALYVIGAAIFGWILLQQDRERSTCER